VQKRLRLKKVTIRDLDASVLKEIAGGNTELGAATCNNSATCSSTCPNSCNGTCGSCVTGGCGGTCFATCNITCQCDTHSTCGGSSCQYTYCGATCTYPCHC